MYLLSLVASAARDCIRCIVSVDRRCAPLFSRETRRIMVWINNDCFFVIFPNRSGWSIVSPRRLEATSPHRLSALSFATGLRPRALSCTSAPGTNSQHRGSRAVLPFPHLSQQSRKACRLSTSPGTCTCAMSGSRRLNQTLRQALRPLSCLSRSREFVTFARRRCGGEIDHCSPRRRAEKEAQSGSSRGSKS